MINLRKSSVPFSSDSTRDYYHGINYLVRKIHRHIEYYENGQKKQEVELSNAVKNGSCKEWYESGTPKTETSYKAGELNGSYKEWYSNRDQKIDARYKNGIRHGFYTCYYENGKTRYHTRYDEGKVIQDPLIFSAGGARIEGSSDFLELFDDGQITKVKTKYASLALGLLLDHTDRRIWRKDTVGLSPVISNEEAAEYLRLILSVYFHGSRITIDDIPVNSWLSFKVTAKDQRSNEQLKNLLSAYGIIDTVKADTLNYKTKRFHESTTWNINTPVLINWPALDFMIGKDCSVLSDYVYISMHDGRCSKVDQREHYTEIILCRGAGDCPAGCTLRESETWRVYKDGTADLVRYLVNSSYYSQYWLDFDIEKTRRFGGGFKDNSIY
jgi:hypothetical protein